MSFGGPGSLYFMQSRADETARLAQQQSAIGEANNNSVYIGSGLGRMTGTGSSSSGGGSVAPPAQGYMPLNNTQDQTDPWSRYRGQAGDQLNGMRQNDPSDFYKNKLQEMSSGQFSPDDPSYQFRFDQGQQAVERSLASKGLLNSGNAAIELQQYGQQAASQEYGAQFDRMLKGMSGVSSQYDTQMQRLMSMAGVGLDPSTSAKLNIETFKANNELYGMGLQADTSKYVADVGAAASQANAQTAASASTSNARMGSYSADLNAMVNAANTNYNQTMNNSMQNALSTSLFLGGY